MSRIKTIREFDLKNKKVFLRVDFNVPIKENQITDDSRIKAVLPTIEYLIENLAIPIIASHLGRPKGKEKVYSLRIVAQHLASLLKREVKFLDDCIGSEVKSAIASAKPGDVLLLENLRFYSEEEKNDLPFAQSLAEGIDIYINEAFSASHRAHSSIVAITNFVKETCAGFLFMNEVSNLKKVLENPERPVVLIIGGAKISDKLGVIKNLLPKVDYLLLGGGVVFTFYKALNYEIGQSIFEEQLIEEARLLSKEKKVILPEDILVASEIKETAHYYNSPSQKMPKEYWGVDIGIETITRYKKIISEGKTIIWAGPMGIFEIEPFASGTREIAFAITEATKKGAYSLVGGGDTLAATNKFGLKDKFSFTSTAGGATLEFLEGKELPGIKALEK